MDTIRVCLRKGHHSVYDDLVRFPPENVVYEIPKGVTQSKNKTTDAIKKYLFKKYLHLTGSPHMLSVQPGRAQLIHATSGILIKNKFPWVIDTEHAASFAGFEAGRLEKVRPKAEALLSSPFCKKIMPWTEAGKLSLVNGLNAEKFSDKIEVVYPAMKPLEIPRRKHDGTNLLFVSVRFFTKGGRELLEAFEKLEKKEDVHLTIVSDVPNTLKEKYKTNTNITFLPPTIPRKQLLEEHFASADLFVLPSYMDTFGMVFLEAMSLGIPIVSTNVFAIQEIVGSAGLCVPCDRYSWYGKDALFAWKSWEEFSEKMETEKKPEIVAGLVSSISTILNDKKLALQMSATGKKEIETGRFSISRRNSQLRRIYEEALRA